MKKNIFSVLLLVIASVFLLASCAKKKAEILTKEWLVKEAKYAGMQLSEDLVSGRLTLRSDSTFSRLEAGQTADGKWALSADETKIILTFNDAGDKVEYAITELNEEKLIIKGKEMGMEREYTLAPVPAKK
jgi:hypothetical protein